MRLIKHYIKGLDDAPGTTPSATIPVTASLLTSGGSNIGGAGVTSATTASISPTANKLIVCFVGTSAVSAGQDAAPVSIVGAGLSFTKVAEFSSEVGWENQSVWVACDASVSTGTLAITCAVAKTQYAWAILEFDNVDVSSANNGLGAIAQVNAATTGTTDNTTTTVSGMSNFANTGNATLLYWNAATAAGTPMTTTGSAGLTELLDSHDNAGIGWDVHQSVYFQNSQNRNGVVTASQAAGANFKITIALEIATQGAALTDYTLTADSASYTVSGSAAGLKYGRKIDAANANYAVTGSDAGLKRGYKVGAGTGSYPVTGSAASTVWYKKLLAAIDAYTVTGAIANLFKGRTMAADSASYSITGFATSLRRAYKASGGTGSYSLVGSNATLGKTQLMSAGIGAYVLTGSDVAFRLGLKLVGQAGTYGFVGSSVELKRGYRLLADNDSYDFSYQDASLAYKTRLSAEAGVYDIVGFPVTFIKTERESNVVMTAEPAEYLFERFVAELISTTRVYRRINYRKYGTGRRLGIG